MNSKDLIKLGFQKAADIFIRNGVPDAIFNDFGKQHAPGVYCWVEKSSDSTENVIYVGMYGQSIHKRFSEHKRGFKGGSGSGLKNAKYICESIDKLSVISIYGKPSDVRKVYYENLLGVDMERDITFQDQDEKDMLAYYVEKEGRLPELNRTKGG